MNITLPGLEELLKAGVHFGHKTSRWHPKMAPFIFGERSGVHIVHLEKTQEQLGQALEFVKSLGKEGKVLLLGIHAVKYPYTSFEDMVKYTKGLIHEFNIGRGLENIGLNVAGKKVNYKNE